MAFLTLTRKIRFFPTLQQERILWDLSEKCRLLYNFALAERLQNWESNRARPSEERTYINYTKQQNDLPAIKAKHPEYAWVYSKVLQMVLRRLDGDYKSFFARYKRGDYHVNPPRFKGKNYFTTLCYNQSGFRIDTENKSIRFSHNHPSGVELLFSLPWLPKFKGKVKQVEILKDTRNRWFVAIISDEEVPFYVDNGFYQAIDLGIINLVTAVNIHGKFIQIQNRRPDKYWRKKIREVQSRRDHCRKFSNKWHRYSTRLRKMQQKLANQLRDFQHKISKHVVENTRANTIIIGALKIEEMATKKNLKTNHSRNSAQKTLNHSIQNTGFMGRFAEFLTYKAKKVGKKVTRIDEAYTTQTCCICGKIRHRRLSERRIHCDCGTTLDRDQNAAVNIMIRFLSQKPPVNGELSQNFLNSLHRNTALHCIPSLVDSMKTPVTTSE